MLNAIDNDSFDKLLRFSERSETERANYELWIRKLLDEIKTVNGISVEKLRSTEAPFTVLKELLEPKGFSSELVFEVMDILDSSSGVEVHSETHRVVKNREELLISELNLKGNEPALQFEILIRSDVKSLETKSNVALIDADSLEQSELQVRKWKQGDKFKPLGMKGWKLLSDFLIDQKLSIPEKEQTWLLTFQGQIVWVIGMRLDDRFKITDSTQKVLRVHY